MTDTPSLNESNDRSKAVQKTPWRVDLGMMKARVASVEYIHPNSIPHMTIAIVVLDNGYALQGMSAPADAANFNAKLGEEYAYEDAMRKMWPLEAYVMRDVLSGNATVNDGRWAPVDDGNRHHEAKAAAITGSAPHEGLMAEPSKGQGASIDTLKDGGESRN